MRESLNIILEIQELDMKMIRLMKMKKERKAELAHIHQARDESGRLVALKEEEVLELKKNIRILESQVADCTARIERLEAKQNTLKKVEEFSALSQEVTSAEREKTQFEQQVSDCLDRLAGEEDLLKQAKESDVQTKENCQAAEKEVSGSIDAINKEGLVLEKEREELVKKAPEDLFKIYTRLLYNKQDRVVVPIENRTCSGCHIVLTAQHENLVRRGERPVFCEHCSRMNYWPDVAVVEGAAVVTKRRRRKAAEV